MSKKFVVENFKKRDLTVYIVLRGLVILTMILQFLQGNFENVFLCFFTLVLLVIPIIINKTLVIKLPSVLENIIFIFIFSAQILGEVQNFYTHFPYWDTILHTLNGFLCAALGFSLVDLLNTNEKFSLRLSPIFVSLIAFSVSMTIGIFWEFFEYSADKIFYTDMQKDTVITELSTISLHPEKKNKAIILNKIDKTIIYAIDKDGKEVEYIVDNGYLDIGLNDTIEDLFVNFIGASIFSLLGYMYIKHRDDKYKFIEAFIITLKNEEEIEIAKKEIEEYEKKIKQRIKEKEETKRLKNKK